MLGMPACCWGHLACILGGEKIYLGSIVIKLNSAALCTAIGGAGWGGLHQRTLDVIF